MSLLDEPKIDAIGRYHVLEELGRGAMGIVYLCVDPRLARPVAIKVLKESEYASTEEQEQFHARFRQEAEAAGRLSHPDIVQLFDIGPNYLVMEFIEGRTLLALLRAGGTLPVPEIVRIVERVAEALDHAHRNGVVHRDIKPANIMLQADGGVKVMDFGVARLESSTLTAVGTVLGSLRYMAPEQMMGERVDSRADVFSLAAVAYELLTGRAPFPGQTVTEVVTRVVHGQHVPAREVDVRLPDALDAVFAQVFSTDPSRRFANAPALASALGRALRPAAELHVSYGPAETTPTRVLVPAGPVEETVNLLSAVGPALPETHQADPFAPTQIMAAATQLGLLTIDSLPTAAAAFVDGVALGPTPIALLPVVFGERRVRLELADHRPVEFVVTLTPAQRVAVVSAELPRDTDEWPASGADVTPPVRIAGELPHRSAFVGAPPPWGTCVLEVLVAAEGLVAAIRVVSSAGERLDQAVVEAVSAWRFAPARRAGQAVAVRLLVQHTFGG